MTPYEQAQRYLAAIAPAVSGQNGHAQTLSAARALVWGFNLPQHEAKSLLMDWNRSCQPPWSEHELDHKLSEADRVAFDKPRGHLLSKNGKSPVKRKFEPPAKVESKPPAKKYEVESTDLPEPIEDGARNLIHALFKPGEGIRIAAARLNDEGREVPESEGVVLSREEWLKKLTDKAGDPNGLWYSTKKTGIYVTVNPMKLGGSKDADVTAFRHALVEFDSISQPEQYNLYLQSRIPCAAIIDSGGKSVHAWVKIDAKDRREYDERVKLLYDHFKSAGYDIDVKNRNPSRFSRLPNCVRFNRRQELLALNVGCESFSEWCAETQAAGIGTVLTFEQLDTLDTSNDPNTVLGYRWLCRGGSCLLIGPSGVGKSSLVIQMLMTWALGEPFCGIKPVKPLRTLVIQAENDDGDMAEVVQGVRKSMGVVNDGISDRYQMLIDNLVFVRDTTHTGDQFTLAARRLIDYHKPDLVLFDPLLSFIGDDISRQDVCSHFLRNLLNPISEATGVVWLCVHHTGKPPSDKDARKGWQGSDWAYAGIGSSELTNWARAAMVLRQAGDGVFELKLAKRGKRAGAVHPDGRPTQSLWLKHADVGIYWSQVDPPEEPVHEPKNGGKSGAPKKVDCVINDIVFGPFLNECKAEGETKHKLAKRMESFLATKGKKYALSYKSCEDVIAHLADEKNARMLIVKDGLYFRGPNA